MSQTTESGRGLWVAELAAGAGISADTVRYYERAGLLPAPSRTAANYRVYDETTIDRLHFIQGTQRLGLRLREIRELLTVRDTGTCPCEPADRLLRRRLIEIEVEMARLDALRTELAAMVEALPSQNCPDPQPGAWCPPAPNPERR